MSSKLVDGSTLLVTYNATTASYSYGRIHDIFASRWQDNTTMGTVTLPVDSPTMVLIFQNDLIMWDRVVTVTRAVADSKAVKRLEVGNGVIQRATPETNVLLFEANTFQLVPMSAINSAQSVPTSLYLPNRVGQQVSGGLNITVQMALSPKDPLSLVSVFTNTWGQMSFPFGAVKNFRAATTDGADIEVLSRLEVVTVQFNVIGSITSETMNASGDLPMYWITTANPSGMPNWMNATGLFIG